MDNLARMFDQPVDSVEHRRLAEECWMGGSGVSVRYWLGRLIGRNLFRESDEAVTAAMRQYFLDCGQERGASLVADLQAWDALTALLRYRFELSEGIGPSKKPKLICALDAMMSNPGLNNAQLAAIAKTTEKQIKRMSDVFALQRVWKFQSSGAW